MGDVVLIQIGDIFFKIVDFKGHVFKIFGRFLLSPSMKKPEFSVTFMKIIVESLRKASLSKISRPKIL